MSSLSSIVASACGGDPERSVLVVLGSGMNACFAEGEVEVMGEWRGRGVEGHPGLIARWEHSGCTVMLGLGRRHLYEGYSAEQVSELIDAAGKTGIRRLLLTNAAGSLNPSFHKGDLVLHHGYVSTMLGRLGLVHRGSKDERRSMFYRPSEVELRARILEKGIEQGLSFHEGVYAGVIGPSYETRAEIRMLRRMGADLVGMSTIIEAATAASHMMTVIGLSLVTNVSSDVRSIALSHDEVTETSAISAINVRRALEVCVEELMQ